MDAIAAMNYLLYILLLACDDLTVGKLTALLWLAQGFSLREQGEPLFAEDFVAADSGPLLPSVQEHFGEYGDRPVQKYDAEGLDGLAPEREEPLFHTAARYGRCTEDELRDLMRGTDMSWCEACCPEHPADAMAVIPKSLIRELFSRMVPPAALEREFAEDDFVGYRNAEGFLVLPRDWGDDEDAPEDNGNGLRESTGSD